MIMRSVMSVKLHGLCVTNCELLYSGSITLPSLIMKSAQLSYGDMVSIYNFNNGARYDTYVIEGTDDTTVGINGPSARLCYKGDRIVVAQYVVTDEKINPLVLFFDDQNREVEFESVF